MTLREFLKSIADAIRSKEGSSEYIPAMSFAERILAIVTGHDVSGVTATENDVLNGAVFVNASGEEKTGAIPKKAAATYTPGTSDQTIASGQYLSGAQTIKGDANLKAENIKSGVSIFNVSGEMESGIDTSDATATAADMATGKSAYVNGEKVTGKLPVVTGAHSWFNSTPRFTEATGLFNLINQHTEDKIFRAGSTMYLAVQTSEFGDATAADVAKGKTFTSKDGLKVTGTGAEPVVVYDIYNGSVPVSIDSAGMLTVSIPNVKQLVAFGLFIDSDDYYVQFGTAWATSAWGQVHMTLCSPSDDVGTNGAVEVTITANAIVLDCSGGRLGTYMIGSNIGLPRGSVAVVLNS